MSLFCVIKQRFVIGLNIQPIKMEVHELSNQSRHNFKQNWRGSWGLPLF